MNTYFVKKSICLKTPITRREPFRAILMARIKMERLSPVICGVIEYALLRSAHPLQGHFGAL